MYFETKRHIRYITQYEQAKNQINHTHPGDSEFFLITTFFTKPMRTKPFNDKKMRLKLAELRTLPFVAVL